MNLCRGDARSSPSLMWALVACFLEIEAKSKLGRGLRRRSQRLRALEEHRELVHDALIVVDELMARGDLSREAVRKVSPLVRQMPDDQLGTVLVVFAIVVLVFGDVGQELRCPRAQSSARLKQALAKHSELSPRECRQMFSQCWFELRRRYLTPTGQVLS